MGVTPWASGHRLEVFVGLSVEGVTVHLVPLTFPAHQTFVLPLKLWRPRWFDGTALVVGSGSPDLFNAFANFDTFDSHGWDGIAAAVPFAIIYAILLRRFAADGLFGSMPDFGPLRVKSYRVLKAGRPGFLVTALSGLIGVASHVLVDSFTHTDRFGANLFGLNRVLLEGSMGPVHAAKLLQYIGHTFGSLVGVVLFVLVVSRRHLAEWYGGEEVTHARDRAMPNAARPVAIAVLTVSVAVGAVWGWVLGTLPIFHVGFCLVLAFLVVGIINGRTGDAARFSECLDTCIHHDMRSSTLSVERSLKTSHRSAT
ncbi:MAG: hypothetical protein ACI81L_000277 [Verrucomicrobiales bacterium]|jgi:hypothetical protein